MSLTCADDPAEGVTPAARLEELFDELAEATGQRNAIDGRIVGIIAEIERAGLAGFTGVRSTAALVAWKTGCSPKNAETLTTIAKRSTEFPTCVEQLRQGSLSLDQVGVIAERGGAGSDAHYAELAASATVSQLRTAIRLEPRPDPVPKPWERSITRTEYPEYTQWRIRLAHDESAQLDAALQSFHDAQIAEFNRHHDTGDENPDTDPDDTEDPVTDTDDPVTDDVDTAVTDGGDADSPAADDNSFTSEAGEGGRPPLPTMADAFMALMQAGWDTDVAARPHGARTTVIAHLDVEARIAALHLGPILSDADRQYLLCDATVQVWFDRDGIPIGCGRTTRTISRRLRRALEHRDHGTCVVPGCGATRGLQGHHLIHWEDGGPTELDNLVLLCPLHHRMHHKGQITLIGPATRLVVTDDEGNVLHPGSLARPPTTAPPQVPPYRGPTGERADWKWYTPWEPPSLN